MRPRRITAQILLVFLEIAGYRLWTVYKRQFMKLLQFIQEEYLSKIPKESIAAATRLKIWLEEVAKKGMIDKILVNSFLVNKMCG